MGHSFPSPSPEFGVCQWSLPISGKNASQTAALTASLCGSGQSLTQAMHLVFASSFCFDLHILNHLCPGFCPDIKSKPHALICLQQASKSCLTHFRRNGLTEVCKSFFQKGIYSLLEFQCFLGMRALAVSQILKVLIPGLIYTLMLNYYLTVFYVLLPI